MPSKSRSQQRLMQAAEHGATFPKAQAIRRSMSPQQMHDFAAGSEAGKPQRVTQPRPNLGAMAAPRRHPGGNLGKYLHPPRKKS